MSQHSNNFSNPAHDQPADRSSAENLQLADREWIDLIRRVFGRRPSDRAIALLVDLPDSELPDRPAWKARRRLAQRWHEQLASTAGELGLQLGLFVFRNARTNNAPLPDVAWQVEAGQPIADDASAYQGSREIPFAQIFDEHQIFLAPTELSATAPLKLAAKQHGFRAATMPRFSPEMTPALRLDYGEIDRRCRHLQSLLDRAEAAEFVFRHEAAGTFELTLDLRHRTSHVSSGLLTTPSTAGNLPSGETYIVPYEGELPSVPSQSRGKMPVELDGEVVVYSIEGNRAVGVEGSGPVAERERELLRKEPAYGNIAELGLGVLADFGLRPIGEILLDEKLGLHIAFGRSDHFGGITAPGLFSKPENAVHIDRVYLPETQPQISVPEVDLVMPDGSRLILIRNGVYPEQFFAESI